MIILNWGISSTGASEDGMETNPGDWDTVPSKMYPKHFDWGSSVGKTHVLQSESTDDVLCSSSDFQHSLSRHDSLASTDSSVNLSFRDKHHFLDEVYNCCSNTNLLSAKNLDGISRKAHLSMEEVLAWFEDEKKRRARLFAVLTNLPSSYQVPSSPTSTTTPASYTTAELITSQYPSPGTLSHIDDMLSPQESTWSDDFKDSHVLRQATVSTRARRGRPARGQILKSTGSLSPESKRQKCLPKYPCPDCNQILAADRWSEHVKRVHFPEQVWECPKFNQRTGKQCGSKAFFRTDNFATHLKGEHGCSVEEISQLKTTCKFRTANLFHQICGFCEVTFNGREESIEHIKNHFREISERTKPPIDLGLSEWKDLCHSDHKIKRGVHYYFKDETSGSSTRKQETDDVSLPGDNVDDEFGESSKDRPVTDPPEKDEDNVRDINLRFQYCDDLNCMDYQQCSAQDQTPRRYWTPGVSLRGHVDSHTNYVDPSIIHESFSSSLLPAQSKKRSQAYSSVFDWSAHPMSLVLPSDSQNHSHTVSLPPDDSLYDLQSPYAALHYDSYSYPQTPRSIFTTDHSYNSQHNFASEELREKGQCPNSDCGKIFKDLKAHMLTHQNERPEKCPIQTCDYHVKGFARKYDKMRHTLTHYKGTMICGFCPVSAEKSFNRADVFKRHLMSVHAVEQTPLNSRKRSAMSQDNQKLLPDATGNCSTCNGGFSNAQDFYEHLDDCVLRIVHQEEPPECQNS